MHDDFTPCPTPKPWQSIVRGVVLAMSTATIVNC